MLHLNCDMGESYGRFQLGQDEALMPYIRACNIACGFHGGDPSTIARTLRMAIEAGVEIGAHPSFPDLPGFGRRTMQIAQEELYDLLLYQVAALKGMAEALGGRLKHVKPHGALYHAATRSREVAAALLEAVWAIDPALSVYGPADIGWHEQAQGMGLHYVHEAFADRHYLENGHLVPRSQAGALLTDPHEIAERALRLAEEGKVRTLSGVDIALTVDTVCLHGDHPAAVEVARLLSG